MKKPQRTGHDHRNPAPRTLDPRELSKVGGGTNEGVQKLGNKIWQDDWLAPV